MSLDYPTRMSLECQALASLSKLTVHESNSVQPPDFNCALHVHIYFLLLSTSLTLPHLSPAPQCIVAKDEICISHFRSFLQATEVFQIKGCCLVLASEVGTELSETLVHAVWSTNAANVARLPPEASTCVTQS